MNDSWNSKMTGADQGPIPKFSLVTILYLVIFHDNPCNYDFFGILQNPIVPKEEAADAKVSTNFDRKLAGSLKSLFFFLSANLFCVRENTFSFKTFRLRLKCSNIEMYNYKHIK